jgi:hypothetical protein
VQAAETTQIKTTSSAISTNYKDIPKRTAERGLRKTNCAEMPKDKHTGPESISWRRIRIPNPSMQYISQRTKTWMATMTVLT